MDFRAIITTRLVAKEIHTEISGHLRTKTHNIMENSCSEDTLYQDPIHYGGLDADDNYEDEGAEEDEDIYLEIQSMIAVQNNTMRQMRILQRELKVFNTDIPNFNKSQDKFQEWLEDITKKLPDTIYP
jgi:hypothetical protein